MSRTPTELVCRFERRFNGGQVIFVWTPRQVAQLLGVTPATARAYMRDYEYLGFYSFEVGPERRLRIEREDLVVALEARQSSHYAVA